MGWSGDTHLMHFVKSEDGITELIKRFKELNGPDIKYSDELIFQETVSDSDSVIKFYLKFEKIILRFNNCLPFKQFKEFEEFDAKKISKTVVKVEDAFINKLEKNLAILKEEFIKYGVENCGLDLIHSLLT